MHAAFAFLLAVLCVSAAQAQEFNTQKVRPANVLSGARSFVPLSTWEEIKLGSAYYTDPKAVVNAPVAYTFDPKVFTSELFADFRSLEQKQLVVCGIYQRASRSLNVIPCPFQFKADMLEHNVRIISSTPTLFGQRAQGIVKKIDMQSPY